MAYALDIAWNGGSLDDRRFRRVLLVTGIVFLLMSVIVARLPVFKVDRPVVEEVPKRIARLVLEKRRPVPPPPPPPKVEEKKPEPKPVEEKKPEPKPEPKKEPKPEPKPQPSARERASRAGIMAFQDTLAELRQDSAIAKLESSKQLTSAGQTARTTERSLVTSKLAKGSGGINTAALSRDTGATELVGRSVEKVKSPVKPETGKSRSNDKNRLAGRTDEEIKLVFDRNKSAIYNLYNRALRANPSLRGTLVIRLTIAPSGEVTSVQLVSSELGDDSLERKLVLRIKRFDFGAKAVAATTVKYTIDLFPS